MRNDMPLSLSPQTTYHLGNIRQVTMDDGSKQEEVIQQSGLYDYPIGNFFWESNAYEDMAYHGYWWDVPKYNW